MACCSAASSTTSIISSNPFSFTRKFTSPAAAVLRKTVSVSHSSRFPRSASSSRHSFVVRASATMEQRKGRRILLFPLPLQGHITPMLELAQILHSNGFSITIIHTNFNSPNPSNYPDFTFCPIPDGLDQSDRATMADIPSLLTFLNTSCQDPLEKCLEKLMSDEENNEPVGCLISDDILHFTQGVAEKMKIPRVVLRPEGGVCSFRAFAAFNLLREKGYLPIQDSQLEQEIEELAPLKVKDLPFPIINNSDPEKTYQLIESMVMSIQKSSGLIFNTFEELEQPSLTSLRNEFPCPVFTVGPFHKFTSNPSTIAASEDDDSCIKWLDKQAPGSVIYVSFGGPAAVVQTETEFKEIAWGLSIGERPFVIDIRPGYISNLIEPEWFKGPKGNGLAVKTDPYIVLAHPSVGAFWMHCDWDSTLNGISEGVPLICMPCYTDQKVHSRFVCDVWKVGVEVQRDGIERGKIEGLMKRLFEEKEGEEIRSRALAMKKKASDSVREGGSSQQSIESLVNHILTF